MRPYELKKHCCHRGLCEVGQKATLVARLEGAPEAQPGHAAPVPENDPGAQIRNAALMEASKIGDVGQIQALLADGAPVDAVDVQGYTPLYCATMYGQEQAVAALLAAGAEVDRENNNGVSPLIAAARDGVTAIAGVLLAAGADVSQVDAFGRTAHSIAVAKGHPATAAVINEWAATHPPPAKVIPTPAPEAPELPLAAPTKPEEGGSAPRPNSGNQDERQQRPLDLTATMRRSYDWLDLSSEDEEEPEPEPEPKPEYVATPRRCGSKSVPLLLPSLSAGAALRIDAKKRWQRSDTRLLKYYSALLDDCAPKLPPILQRRLQGKESKYAQRIQLAERRASKARQASPREAESSEGGGERALTSVLPLDTSAGSKMSSWDDRPAYMNLSRRADRMRSRIVIQAQGQRRLVRKVAMELDSE